MHSTDHMGANMDFQSVCTERDAAVASWYPVDDPHLDIYTMYRREVAKYGTDYVKCDEDLNTTLTADT